MMQCKAHLAFSFEEDAMRLTESQFVRMATTDKQLLLKLAEFEERTPSDVVRRLIRQAAASRGWAMRAPTRVQHQVEHTTQPCAART